MNNNMKDALSDVSLPESLGSATSEGWIQAPITHYFVFWRAVSGDLVTGNPASGYVSSQVPGYMATGARVQNADTGRVRAILQSQLDRMDAIFRKLG